MRKIKNLFIALSVLFCVLGLTFNYAQEKSTLNKDEEVIRKSQIATLDSIQLLTKSQLTVQWNNDNTAPNMIAGKLDDGAFLQSSISHEQAAIKFLEKFKNVFVLKEPKQELKIAQRITDDLGNTHLKFDQYYQGLSIFGAQLIVHFNSRGEIYLFNGRYCPSFILSTQPIISNTEAIRIAVNNSKVVTDSTSNRLVIFPGLNLNDPKLAWDVLLFNKIKTRQQYIIDAKSGRILFIDDGIRF